MALLQLYYIALTLCLMIGICFNVVKNVFKDIQCNNRDKDGETDKLLEKVLIPNLLNFLL